SIFGGVGDGKKEMLRKKTHVVRKKTHVVRKFFYVASIFGGVTRRRNRPPWELSSTAGKKVPTAGFAESNSWKSIVSFPLIRAAVHISPRRRTQNEPGLSLRRSRAV
ncbi:MAG: hypothetical protein MR516_08395, partial [Bacteroidales bacterium]|nr:hypothetical protein [Bacteroidales bacterium]